ncbi:MAG TPA: extracellular solute-binding protein, partial [Burkholderiales bacterium]|nr:extracellular solute-binding protein [Burkholderiales bacterium]
MRTISVVAACVLAAGSAGAQGLFDYSGPDRMAKITAAAKKEGTVTMYTTFAEKDQPTLIRPFEAKYGVKVVIWRAGTDKVLQRTLAEAAARKYDVDLIHFGAPEMEALSREKILQAVNSPVHKDLQPGSVPAHREWAATLLSVWVQVYNTQLIRKEDLPGTYTDLLDPRWKGKLGIEAKNQDWFASVVDVMGGGEKGLQFFRDLVARNGISARTGHTLLNNMVIAGEVPLALTVYNYMPEQAKKKGAPIDWFA